MKLDDAVLKIIIDHGPINVNQIAQKLGKKYNTVKYHVLNLVDSNTILAFPSKHSNEINYEAHPLFDLIEDISNYVHELVAPNQNDRPDEDDSEITNELFQNMNRMRSFMKKSTTNKVKFNLKKLSVLVINEFVEDLNKKRFFKDNLPFSN